MKERCLFLPNKPNANGYVRFRWKHQGYYAHRWYYEQWYGAIPKGMETQNDK